MSRSTCLLSNVLCFTALSLALVAGRCEPAHAQDTDVVPASYQSGSFFNRQLGTALRFNYHTNGYGTQDDVVSLGGMKVHNLDGATVFFDGQGTLSDDFGGGFNLGVGYRELTTLGLNYDAQRILGVGFWTDGQSTGSDNFFTQLGFSLESLGESYDLRLNGHFPLDSTQTSSATLTGQGAAIFQGNNLFNSTERITIDTAYNVVDGEFAKRIRDLEAWAFVGGYYLGSGDIDEGGYRVGVRGYAVPDLAVSLQVTEDGIYGGNLMFGMTWFMGRTNKCNGPCGTILDRFREPVLRNDFIATTSQQFERAAGDPLVLANSTDLVSIVHVDSSGGPGGDGTFENPFENISEAGGAGSAPNDIILVHGGSTFVGAEGQIALQENQRLLGEGVDQDGSTVNHFVQTTIGDVFLPETAPGAQMLARPDIDGMGIAGAMFDLADGAAVDNFTIRNATTGIAATGVTVPTGNTVANVLIEDSGTGIALNNVMGAAEIDSNVLINGSTGTALLIDGGNESITMNGSINDSTGMSLVVRGRDGGAVQFAGTINDDTDDNDIGTSTGVLIENNTGGTVSFDAASTLAIEVDTVGETGFNVQNNTGTSVTGTGVADVTARGDSQAVRFAGNDDASSLTFSDLMATAENGDTVDVVGDGTVAISSAAATPAREIVNTGTGEAVNVDGNAMVTINSNVVNSGGGNAVDMRNRTLANNVVFNGNVMSTDAGGINVENNSAGSMVFSGETRLENTAIGNTDNALTMVNNEGATVSFTDIQAAAVDGNTIDVTGGGTLTITDTNMTNMIENTGTGTAFRNVGDNAAGVTGDAIVDITSPIVNGGGGRSVDIQDRASNTVTFNGTVEDNGDGLLVMDNIGSGTIDFTQAVTSTTVDTTAIDLNNNTGTTIQFNGVMATTTGTGTAFRGIGGGNLLVASPNTPGDNTVDTQMGIGLELRDMTIDAGNVTFEIFNVRNFGPMGMVLQNLDGTGQVAIGGTDATHMSSISSAGTAISVDNAANVAITNVDIGNNAPANAGEGVVVINQAAGSVATFNDVEINTEDGDAVNVRNNVDGNISFTDLVATTSGTGGAVVASNNAAATLSINGMTATATGAGAGFSATGTGNLAVTGATSIDTTTGKVLEIVGQNISANSNFDTVNASGVVEGPAVELRNVTGSMVTVGSGTNAGDGGTLSTEDTNGALDSFAILVDNAENVTMNNITIDNSNPANNGGGLEVRNNTAGTRTFNGMNLMTEAQAAVHVHDNSGGTTTFNDLTADSSAGGIDAVVIEDNTGGTIDVNTATVTADLGNGIELTNNTVGAITLDDLTVSAAGNAIDVTNSDDVTIDGATISNTTGNGLVASNGAGDSLSVSNINVTTTTGNGVQVAGGTFTAAGANTITTTSGTGLNISNATIGAAGASFNEVDVDGATNGIVLNNLTGAGQVTVGSGAAASTLNTTGDAIVITNVANVDINNVDVTTAARGLVVTNNNANALDVSINDLTVVDGATAGIEAIHTGAGDFTLAVTNSNFSDAVDVNANGIGDVDFMFNTSVVNLGAENNSAFTLNLGDNVTSANIQIDDSDFTNADAVAFDFDSTSPAPKNVTFQLTNSTATNSSASAAAEIDAFGSTIMNATITDNVFTNTGAGDNLDFAANDATTIINADILRNVTSGGTDSIVLRELNVADFNIVDGVNVEANNPGTANFIYDSVGNVNGDFDDIPALP